MNPIARVFSFTLFPVILLASCAGNAPEQQAPASSTPTPDTIRFEPASKQGASTYAVTNATVFWSAKRALGPAHIGTINVSGGELQVNQGQLVGGRITIDMASIAVTNMDDPSEKATLESHLKDKDFFEVKKFPAATFEITEVLPSSQPAFNWVVRGNLTIRDKSQPVNVPVHMTITGEKLHAESVTFVINRTQWGITFRSGLLGTAKDKVVEDVVPLSLKLDAAIKN